jgi:hypothetical protein
VRTGIVAGHFSRRRANLPDKTPNSHACATRAGFGDKTANADVSGQPGTGPNPAMRGIVKGGRRAADRPAEIQSSR